MQKCGARWALVFRLFRETGSAYAVDASIHGKRVTISQASLRRGVGWQDYMGSAEHSRVLGMLKNPSYAGMYVFGRYQYRREISPDGEVHKRMQAVAMPDWRVSLKQHHEGYITLEEFVKNQERLEKNRTNGEETVLSGPAREGLALLQGLLLCGNCGHALTVRYRGNGGICPTLSMQSGCVAKAWLPSPAWSFAVTCSMGSLRRKMLKALQPAELELALAALHELESRDQTILRQWQMRLERAEYEVALAERRYQEVDPANRLVAGTLERRWNDALLHLEDLKKQAAEFQRQEAHVATPEQKAKVLALARDLPRLWHAPTTQSKDRKRMLRLLIKDITVEKPANQKQLLVHIRWQGGACSDVCVQLPPNIADRVRYPSAVVDRVRELAAKLARWRNRRSAQSRRAGQRHRQTLHG